MESDKKKWYIEYRDSLSRKKIMSDLTQKIYLSKLSMHCSKEPIFYEPIQKNRQSENFTFYFPS